MKKVRFYHKIYSWNDENIYEGVLKSIIDNFERVVKCIRYEILDLKDIFNSNIDNFTLIVDLTNSVDLNNELIDLINKFKKGYGVDNIFIDAKYGEKPFRIRYQQDKFNIYNIELEVFKDILEYKGDIGRENTNHWWQCII